MKPVKTPLKFNVCLTALSVVFFFSLPAAAQTWNALTPSPANWQTATNWTPNAIPNAVNASALLSNNINAGTLQISLNAAVTLGNLTMGDSNSATNGFFNVQNGTGGSLTFDATTGNATLQKTAASSSTDTISATTILTDSLAADIRTGTIVMNGLVSGGGGIIRSGSISGAISSAGGTLRLENNGNTYTGTTTIEHGTLTAILNGDVLTSTNSVLGNSASAVAVGLSTTSASANGTSVLTLQAGSDTANYTMSRGIDFSQGPTAAARATLNFNGNGAGSANTNTLTLSGPLTFGTRASQIQATRGGLTINITGAITTVGSPGADNIRWSGFPSDPGSPNVDGRGAGTIRFDSTTRSYSNSQSLVMGRIIIDGVVAATGSSPIGTQSIGLGLGSGGNILGAGNFSAGVAASRDTSTDTVRSIFLESAGSSYARTLAPGVGSSSTPTGYGSTVNVINGYQLGGLNTSGIVRFTGAITPGDPTVGTSTTNIITNAVNLALIAQTGGTVEFTGGIGDTANAATSLRVTVNQFRNHQNLDGNNGTIVGADGFADADANQLVGTATTGKVIIGGTNTWVGTTEILGGTLLMNGTLSGTGVVTVASAGTLGGTGSLAGNVNVSGVLAPGASIESLGTGSVSFLTGSTFAYELDSTVLNGDLVDSSGTLDITSGTILTLNDLLAGVLSAGSKLTLLSYFGGWTSGELFTYNAATLADNSTFTLGANQWLFDYDDISGGTNFTAEQVGASRFVTITVVPEPTAAMLGGFGLIALLRRRRNR